MPLPMIRRRLEAICATVISASAIDEPCQSHSYVAETLRHLLGQALAVHALGVCPSCGFRQQHSARTIGRVCGEAVEATRIDTGWKVDLEEIQDRADNSSA